MMLVEFRGAAATNWNAYDVPEMWEFIGDYDVSPQWTHVAGWRKTAELTALHLAHIRAYCDQLATAWPPEKNEASRAYLAYIDKLVISVQETYDAAVANHDTMASATGAIMMAKRDLKPIYDRWQANLATMAEYEARVDAAGSGTPAPLPGVPPLPVNWRDALNNQARALMSNLSGELALAAVKVVMPPGYTAPIAGQQDQRPFDEGTASVLAAPLIPPVQPRIASTGQQVLTVRPDGPALTATAPGIADSSVTGLSPSTSITQPSVPTAGLDTIMPIRGNGSSQTARIPQVAAPGVIGSSSVSAIRGGSPAGAQTHALPPGGVIGTSARHGTAHSPRPGTQRVNPVGGIIRGSGTHGINANGTASIHPTLGLRARCDDHGSTVGWDPDDPWTVATGVAPVVEPACDVGRHDPGPAIGQCH